MFRLVKQMRKKIQKKYNGEKVFAKRLNTDIKHNINLKYACMKYLVHQRALATLKPFFVHLSNIASFHVIAEKFFVDVVALQVRMKYTISLNVARKDFITEYWEQETLTYKFALAGSPKKKHKVLLKQFVDIDKELEQKLLSLFIERCKFKHALCFFQYRRLLPRPALTNLREIFDERKQFIITEINKMKRAKKASKVEWSDDEFIETKMRRKHVETS